ncbi:ATP-binding cassette domain-containing protein [Curtobacterium flaccumfaciens]|uniref:ATP-binding cassette domain-containing protein n=1 Tax=Curtobacterium flaccumfaciens TaxID=2035 RepID=UPI0038798013
MIRASTESTGSAAIRMRGLEKRYGRVRAVDGLDLEIAVGDVQGFLGPNGAGKTTTIRILLGLTRATRGHVQVLGGDPWHDAPALHRRMASISGDAALWPGLTGGETIDLLTSLRGDATHSRAVQTRRAALLEEFALDPTKRVRAYSRGNRQKVLLAAALLLSAELHLARLTTSSTPSTLVRP